MLKCHVQQFSSHRIYHSSFFIFFQLLKIMKAISTYRIWKIRQWVECGPWAILTNRNLVHIANTLAANHE